MTCWTPHATPDVNIDKTCNYLGTRYFRQCQSLHLCSWRTDYALLRQIECGDVGLKVHNPLVWLVWLLLTKNYMGSSASLVTTGSVLSVALMVPVHTCCFGYRISVLALQSITHRICLPLLQFVIVLCSQLKISLFSDFQCWKNCVIFSQNMSSDVHVESWKSISAETDSFLFLRASSL